MGREAAMVGVGAVRQRRVVGNGGAGRNKEYLRGVEVC